MDAFAVGFGAGFDVLGPGFGGAGFGFLGKFDEFFEALEVGVAGLDFLVDDDAIETLFSGNKLGAEGADVRAYGGGDEEGVHGLSFGVFDALGNFDFLFAREQGDLAHLL